jgi:Tol biopolymer transport system component
MDGHGRDPSSLGISVPDGFAWSPDGTRIAFTVLPSLRSYVARLTVRAGSVALRRREIAGRGAGATEWSPDGRKLLFAQEGRDWCRGAGDCADAHRIETSNADGSGRRVLTSYDCVGRSVWSPSGREIAFVVQTSDKTRGPHGEVRTCWEDGRKDEALVVMRANGTHARTLVRVRLGFEEYAWSPDGRTIVISKYGLITLPAAGGRPRPVPHTSDAAYGGNPSAQPQWSRDGKRIFYIADGQPCQNGGCAGYTLFAINADGSGKRNLTPDLKKVGRFALSPDGGRVAVVGGDGRVADLFLLDSNGRSITKVANPKRNETDDPAWSPDGKELALTRVSGRFKTSMVFLVNTDGSALTDASDGNAHDSVIAWRP